MRLITVAGPPASGKTSVLLKTIEYLRQKGYKTGIVKFDCLQTEDDILFEKMEFQQKKGYLWSCVQIIFSLQILRMHIPGEKRMDLIICSAKVQDCVTVVHLILKECLLSV